MDRINSYGKNVPQTNILANAMLIPVPCNILIILIVFFALFYLSGIPMVVVSLVLVIDMDAYGMVSMVEDTPQSGTFGKL